MCSTEGSDRHMTLISASLRQMKIIFGDFGQVTQCSQQMCGNVHLHKDPELGVTQIFSTSDHTVLVHRAAQSYFMLWIACLSLSTWLIRVGMEVFTIAPMKDAGILTGELQTTAGLQVHTFLQTRQQWHDRLMPTMLSCTFPRAQAIKHRGHLLCHKTSGL